ncbi:hypothetical protein E4U43_002388 [Claviceps pusilla]|uniref:Cyclin-D1-binding protein 1-like N-terminal domain-containing protein n=1 Tax=Claviceps pusilla TaxID=123648 RepID=A0A9P7N6D5_9HYPO|nr:hypothetical protein E4U43_002388 [Claviceps pusilla]
MAPRGANALQTLDALIHTASELLTQLQSALSELQSNPASQQHSSPVDPTINALSLAHDSASLIRAHGTKISLLIINEPFTPSAISTVLRELIAGPIPGLASSAQACTSAEYTEVIRVELASKARRVLSELSELIQKIPRDGKVLSKGSSRSGFAPGEKGSLPATGLLWAACDEIISLSKLGVRGVFAKKMDQWRDTLCDIMEELKDWGDEEPEDDDDDDDADDDHDDVDDLANNLTATSLSPQALLDQIMNSQPPIPKSDPHGIRPRLETSLRRLRLVTLLFQALLKHRLKNLPSFPAAAAPSSSIAPRLDEMANRLGTLPDRFGDLACAFYELQPHEIDRVMDQCFGDASDAASLFVQNWEGETDTFSEWLVRFRGEMKKA